MSPLDVEKVGLKMFLKYEAASQIVEAQELLSQLAVADYPHMKKESRQKLHREVFKRANPKVFDQPKRVATLEDVARMLANGRR